MLRKGNTFETEMMKVRNGRGTATYDDLATEEPLEIRLYSSAGGVEVHDSVSVTMRTPGNDFELSAGFLFSEGIISNREQIARISYCVDEAEAQQYNIVNVYLRPDVPFDRTALNRHFYMTSSCGVCGKASLDALHVRGCSKIEDRVRVESEMVKNMLEALRGAQAVFNRTGGLHASGLFDKKGKLQSLREDVGRHNALDKLIGSQLLAGSIPLRERILAVSGRSSFEIVQKSLVAGIPVIVAVGAPSSLAVELARDFNVTLIGFAREDSFNIYSGRERITLPMNVPKADLFK